MNLAAFARFVTKEFSVSGIEPLHAHFPSTSHKDILQLRNELDDAGVFVANIPVDATVDLCSPDLATRDSGNATYRKWIDIARMLRSPGIRVWIPKMHRHVRPRKGRDCSHAKCQLCEIAGHCPSILKMMIPY